MYEHPYIQALSPPTVLLQPIKFLQTKVAAYAKHYLGDGGTHQGTNEGNTILKTQKLFSIHMSAYNGSVIKGVVTIMTSYSSWNGVKMHVNRNLVTGYLKNTLKFKGFVTSYWQGIDRISKAVHNQAMKGAIFTCVA